MRRRAAEYRRPVRRRFSYWIWALFGLFSVAILVLLVVNHNQHEDRVEQPVLVWLLSSPICCFCVRFMILIRRTACLINILISCWWVESWYAWTVVWIYLRLLMAKFRMKYLNAKLGFSFFLVLVTHSVGFEYLIFLLICSQGVYNPSVSGSLVDGI